MFLHLSVSHSVHRGGGGTWAGTPPGRYPLAGTPPWAGTSHGQVQPSWAGTPQAGTPLGRHTPTPWASTPPWQVHPLAGTPPGRYTPPAGTPPSPGRYTPRAGTAPPEQCMLGDTGNKRTVRILLECIFVLK